MSATDSNPFFRPSPSVFTLPPSTFLVASIKGVARRRLVARTIDDEDAFVPPAFTAESLSADDRRHWGHAHPSCLGGEFLPDRRPGEHEVARVTLGSTLADVVAVYAGRCKGGFGYRVVDEYHGDTLTEVADLRCRLPLTEIALVRFLLRRWDLLEVLQWQRDSDYPVERFWTPESTFYPGFAARMRVTVERRWQRWLREQPFDRDED